MTNKPSQAPKSPRKWRGKRLFFGALFASMSAFLPGCAHPCGRIADEELPFVQWSASTRHRSGLAEISVRPNAGFYLKGKGPVSLEELDRVFTELSAYHPMHQTVNIRTEPDAPFFKAWQVARLALACSLPVSFDTRYEERQPSWVYPLALAFRDPDKDSPESGDPAFRIRCGGPKFWINDTPLSDDNSIVRMLMSGDIDLENQWIEVQIERGATCQTVLTVFDLLDYGKLGLQRILIKVDESP